MISHINNHQPLPHYQLAQQKPFFSDYKANQNIKPEPEIGKMCEDVQGISKAAKEKVKRDGEGGFNNPNSGNHCES